MLQQHGIGEAHYIASLVQSAQQLQADPAGTIQQWAKEFGVNLGQGAETDEYDDIFQDPRVSELQGELSQVRQQIQSFEQMQAQSQQQQYEAQIQSFATATDENGDPKHPHFDQVRKVMAGLLQSGVAEEMDAAYEMAVRADPQLYQQSLQQQQTAWEAGQEAKRKAEIEKAEKAAKTNIASDGGTVEQTDMPKDTLREELTAAMNAA